MPPSADAVATYVYCIAKTKSAPKAIPRSVKGLFGTEKPRWLEAEGDFHLLVATSPLSLYEASAIDARLRDIDWVGARAAEHEAVIEHAIELEGVVVVPMKIFTLFHDDARAIAHVKKIAKTLDRTVKRIEGCEEWGLRILFDEARAAQLAAADAKAKRVTSGKDFLLRKKALDDERKSTGAKGKAQVEALYDSVAKSAKSAHRRAAPNRELAGRVFLDAVFLVPSKSVGSMKKTISASAERLVEQGFDVSLTGPWPAYSFIGGD